MAKKSFDRAIATLWLRERPNGAFWCIRIGDEFISTGLPTDRREEAQIHLDEFVASSSRSYLVGSPSEAVRVVDAIHWQAMRNRAGIDEAAADRYRKGGVVCRLNILRPFWSGKSIGDISKLSIGRFVEHRCGALGVYASRDPVGETTAWADLVTLKTAVYGFIKYHSLSAKPEIKIPKFELRSIETLSRDDLARLLWTTLGYSWSVEEGRMVKAGTATSIRFKRLKRRHIARMILISIYTASKCECVTNLRWDASASNSESYIELEGGKNLMFRLGNDAGAGKLEGVPLPLNWRIVAHLKRWFEKDKEKKIEYVIAFGKEATRMDNNPSITFKKMVKEAGLPPSTTMNCLPHSAASYLARRGDVKARSSSILVGIKLSDFMEKYKHLRPDFQEAVMAAFRRRPPSIA